MNKYKVEFTETKTYIVDVKAKSEKEATTKAGKKFKDILNSGIEHHYETEDPCVNVGIVYDVTNTDDPFNP